MSNISNQLIKDSYNYVLQSDISTGVVYRIGGNVPINPIFQSGLTIQSSFNYSDGSEGYGFVLTSDALGNASWKPISGATPSSGVTSITVGNGLSANTSTGAVFIEFTGSTGISGDYLPLSGGTVTGGTIFRSGLSANTISATTYYNLPSITGLYLPLSGGTMTGGLVANSGLTANTISQTSYIDFKTGSTNPSSVAGRLFFDATQKSLSYFDIINNQVPIAMGQQLYTRVWNATGVQIDKGKVIAITGTSNNLPSAILARNVHSVGSDRPIGLAAENIPNGSEGLVLNNGILSGITLNTFANGDTLYLSDTVPGEYVASTTSLSFTARTNEIGYVLETGTTTGKIYVSINNEDSNLSLTDKERNVLEGNVTSSGVYEYTGMTIGTGATINVAYARGWIVRNTYEFANLPDVTNVYYTGGTNIPITNLATTDSTFILINTASTLTQQTTFPTPQQRRENIFLGKVVHPSRTSISSINQTVDFDVSPMAALRDLWTPLKLINQGVIVSPHSTTLEINTSSGTLWGNGIGWTTNQQNPDSVSISGTSPTTFQYRTQLGPLTGGSVTTGNTTTIAPGYYDLNGVVTAVGGGTNSSTNQRVFLFPTGLVRIQLGQTVYDNLAAAVAGAQTEQFTEYSLNRENGILIGIISVNKNATNLSLAAQAVFNLVSKFGEVLGGTGGLSTTTLQQAYDNSSTPEIVINAALDGLSIKNGTGNPDNTTHLLEGVNTAGVVTSFIQADGSFSGTNFSGNTLHISGTSNPVVLKGLTANTSDTNVLSIDTNGNVNTYPISSISGGSSTSGAYLPLSGGTVTGGTIFTNGLTANTISATTYFNLPTDIRVTGGTYNGGNITFTNNTGGTFTVTGITVTSGFSSNYYASFSNNSNLPVSGANTATVWTYDTTEISNGIVIQNNSQIKVNNTGVYEFGYSPQIEKTQGTDATVTIWAAINGIPVTRSSSTLKLVSNSVITLPFVSLIFQMNANDYVEFYFSSDNQYVQLTSLSGLTTPTRPNSPALIIVAKQIGNAVTNTLTGSYLPLSGGTVTGSTSFTGGLTANTISATTYFNLPTDIRVTGGTYSNGTATFTNNTGGTFNVIGFKTNDVFVTGGTKSGNNVTFTNNTGGTFTVTGFTDTFVTGGTYTLSTGTLQYRNNTGGTFSIGGFNYVTGGTYDAGTTTLSLVTNTGQTISIGGFATQVNPAGSNYEIQYNASGSFGSSADLKFDYVNSVFTATNGEIIENDVTYSSVVGGRSHQILKTSFDSGIFAGNSNTINLGSFRSSIIAGNGNSITETSFDSVIAGGTSNSIVSGGYSSTILGGSTNIINNGANMSSIIGGTNNILANSTSVSIIAGDGNNITGALNVVLLGTQAITTVTNDTTYVSNFNINVSPTNNDSNEQVLTRNSTTGNIEYKSSTTFPDTYVTGATYSNNTFTYTNNLNNSFNVLFNRVTGLTVNGNLTTTGTTSSTSFSGGSLTLSNSASTISLNNTSRQQIRFFSAGTGVPTYNTYSSGAKIIFSDNISSISSGYAIGVDAGSLWYGADLAGNGHDWYAGTRKLSSLAGSSGFQLIGLGGPATSAAMTISGTSALGSKGGTGYTDFLQVINNWSGATNPNKWFRVNSIGGFEILNSAYSSQIFSLTDTGILSVAGGNLATTSSSDGVTNYLMLGNNNTQIYDDGNTHIHSRTANQSMWINTNGGQLNLLTQSPLSGGSIGSGIAIATGTLNGYVTINTGRTITTSAAYGYLTTGGAGTYPGGSQSVSISLYANSRIWGQEIDAFSDERMKDIEGEISLEEGIKLVNNLKPIKYTWKKGDDKGLKAGYSAQQVIKSGFDHLTSVIPNEGLEETIDSDGFVSPKDTQFSMNYDQVTPYHGVVIKHLLEKIEELESMVKDLQSKVK